MRPRTALFALLGALALLPACAATVEPEPPVYGGYATVYTTSVPEDIYARPYVYYAGRPAYYVQGRWYTESPRGWVYYRSAPPELERHRPYVQQAPPAPRTAPYAYPPEPAVRVR